MVDLTGKKICTQCGWIGSTADFLFQRHYSNLCKVCRLKRQAEKINKKLDAEIKKQNAELSRRRNRNNALEELEKRKQAAAQNW